ncbi:DNA/RNA helicase domain-containing protein [Nocardia crassostreae]|uniref:DNA/RNA helicase domain-containing protein n=1 Tax=Nocardia crassostreae TaxID=53428 RepID=UPI001FDF5462|nr:DNA/RNA helicase domain-containing protein [Nocardia crassostreae]
MAERLREEATAHLGLTVGHGEMNSWRNSLPIFLGDLVSAGFGDVEVMLEHQLPHSPKRVDVILCGVHPGTRELVFILVELKQWSTVEYATETLVKISHYEDPVLHPVEQVRAYCEYLVDFTPELSGRSNAVYGIAYLHNARSDAVEQKLRSYPPSEFGRLFTDYSRESMIEYLRSLLDQSGGRDRAQWAADEFERFEHAPSKPLLDQAARELDERGQFKLLDEQRTAYELVLRKVARARAAEKRTGVIVLGGPGLRKSVIALSLLGRLAGDGVRVNHATGSAAFTYTLRRVVGERNARAASLFKFFNEFSRSQPDSLGVLICDEAHRIRKSGRDGHAQMRQLIDVAWVPVFLLDEQQIVRPTETGSLKVIKNALEAARYEMHLVSLGGQFRCGGSDAFEAWVFRLLGTGTESAVRWSQLLDGGHDDFVVESADSPASLDSWLRVHQELRGGTARMAAGFCWQWSDPVAAADGMALVDDVRIDGWTRPWNARPGRRVTNAPESHYWASDPRGFDQVGCIYTAQGFEYDWAGVIFGPDFVRRGDEWVARPAESYDNAVRGGTAEEAHALIRNTYKVLLTRGMKGTCVYSTDPETQAFLREMTR